MTNKTPKITLTNKTILLDVSHAKTQGDEITQGGIVIGRVMQSEVPTYGVVVQADPTLSETFPVGAIVPIPGPGILRQFEYPGKDPKRKVLAVRADALDGVVAI